MRRVAIVQARMTSTRLPGKVLADLAGEPMLARQLARLRRCGRLDTIMVATTTNGEDDPVVELCRKTGVDVHRGSEHDVLARYLGAARQADAGIVVRLTADCPLIAAEVVDAVVARVESVSCDYASNTLRRTFPRGLDVEAFHGDVLVRMARLAESAPAREHVTHFLTCERPELFVRVSVEDESDNSDLRWTVDTPEDLQAVRAIHAALPPPLEAADYAKVLELVRAVPELTRINAAIEQKRL